MTDVKSILIVGVGGQGTILVGKILSQGLVDAGYDVKMSEVHGMSQRGGSVSTQVRFGKKVHSPIMELGSADFIVAFEALEGMRWLEYLKPSGKMILNDFKIPSAPILLGKASYPETIIDTLRSKADVTVVNAAGIAKELGDSRTMNVVLLGVLVKTMNLPESRWVDVIRKEVKAMFVDVNIRAFHAGYIV